MTSPQPSAAPRPAGALPKAARPDRQPSPAQTLAPGEALAQAVMVERRTEEKARLIKASEELRRRAVNHRQGLDLVLTPELRGQLERVIAAASPDFEKDILDRLVEMRQRLTGLNGDTFAMVFLLPQLHDLAVEIKGMGGTFGYHLLTDLAKSLQDFLAQIKLPTAGECEIITIHIDAMYMLLMRRIRGQGGDLERQLLISLGYASDKIAGDESTI